MASTDAIKEELFLPLQYPVKAESAEFRAAQCMVNAASVVEISSSSSSSSEGGRARGGHRDLGTAATLAGEVTSPLVSKRPGFLDNQIANGAGPAAKRPRIEINGGGQGHATASPRGRLGDAQRSPACSGQDPDASLPDDFLQPLEEIRQISVAPQAAMVAPPLIPHPGTPIATSKVVRQFWKAGDYESDKVGHKSTSGGMDHVRVHPKFLHSNATSHKWALGAIAELLDNALDEVVHGATFVQVDMIRNPKNGEPMLLIEDDGGGMNPDNVRQCMSLGYSAKSKIANTIGQYGNGFKTSTMRLGADVVVFSRCQGSNGTGPTESIGMLSYTFLRETGQEDIIVPMIDYEIQPFGLRKLIRSNVEDWNRNMESLKRWCPYATEAELMDHFKGMKKQGTKIIVYNLWEDDQGQLELDFVTNQHDIQVRGANRDEKLISMAERFPNSRHYLTYQHSLRSYASILYLRLPPGFRMFLRGKEIEHHNLIDDLMFTEVWTYRPVASDVQRDTGQMKAVVTVGFVKDAKEHIDVQGFNVYHKNRLIKPFWRLWNSAASRGRGIIGVLEANFVEPAHDKQGFERTIVHARLEARLLEMQKTYWSKHCHKVGYVNNTLKGKAAEQNRASSLGDNMHPASVVSAPLPLPTRPSILEPPRLPMRAGYISGVHVPSNVPVAAGLARTMQLHTQIQQLARQDHCVQEAHAQVLRQVGSQQEAHAQALLQVGSQSFPMQSTSVGIASQRHKDFSAPMVNQTDVRVPVMSSRIQTVNTQSQERLPGQINNATRSPLPPPVSSSLRMSQSQPESARLVPPSSHPLSLVNPSQPQARQVSQALATNHVSPVVRTTARNSNSLSGLPSVAWDASLRNTVMTGNASVQRPGPGMETIKTAAASPQPVDRSPRMLQANTGRNNHVLQNFTVSPAVARVECHAPSDPSISTRHVRDNGHISEDSVPSVLETSMKAVERSKGPAGVCVGGGIQQMQVRHLGRCNEQNGQGLLNTGTLTASSSVFAESIGAEALRTQPVGVEASENVSFRLAGDAGENHRGENACPPIVATSSSTIPVINVNVPRAGAAHILPEQSSLRAPKLINKDSALGRKSLEDLGRMFARKAASITGNQGEQSMQLTAPDGQAIESSSKSIVTDCCPLTSKELEAHLVEMELEARNLEQTLETLKVERDKLKQQLEEERLHGQLRKQELQKKVEQAWAKVRELEAQNKRLRLAQ